MCVSSPCLHVAGSAVPLAKAQGLSKAAVVGTTRRPPLGPDACWRGLTAGSCGLQVQEAVNTASGLEARSDGCEL